MSEYSNNHYVPQLILRRYNEKINVYNSKEKMLYEKKNIEKAFSGKNIYPREIELMLQKVEGPFGNFLNNKLLKAESEITLTRKEIDLIKKFLMILQLRSPFSLDERYKDVFEGEHFGIDEVKVENESYEEYIFRTIKVIIESESLTDILKHELRTKQAIKWSLLYYNCYVVIWDSKESKEDFFITDIGMTCEHEKTRFMFEQYNVREELEKPGYLLSKINDRITPNYMKDAYNDILNRSAFVPGNFYMFSISETRMIGLVNPFFRMYYEFDEKPDIWPTKLSREALECNTCFYKNTQSKYIYDAEYNEKDLFTYKIKNLKKEDVFLINSLMLDRVEENLGYVSHKKIIRSLYIYDNYIRDMKKKYGNFDFHHKEYSKLLELIENKGVMVLNPNDLSSIVINRTKFNSRDFEYMRTAINSFSEINPKIGVNKDKILMEIDKLEVYNNLFFDENNGNI